MDKTITVTDTYMSAILRHTYKRAALKKYYAHDANNVAYTL